MTHERNLNRRMKAKTIIAALLELIQSATIRQKSAELLGIRRSKAKTIIAVLLELIKRELQSVRRAHSFQASEIRQHTIDYNKQITKLNKFTYLITQHLSKGPSLSLLQMSLGLKDHFIYSQHINEQLEKDFRLTILLYKKRNYYF